MTWLGHATWILETPGGKRVLFDPFISDNPACPEEYKQNGIGEIDVILVTHGHGDHVGDLVPLARRTGATVVAIFDLTSWLGTKGVENLAGMNKGGTQEVAGLGVTLVDAVHSSAIMEDDRLVYLGDPCGIVLTLEDGFKIYNAGDTAVFGDMRLIAELYEPDLAILPIGDHFTMGPREAAKAIELLGVRRVVPQHFGTFPVLTGTPTALRELVGGDVEIMVVEPGGTLR
jgi:L-ascorbate metabolism protein UlaG (beta-lactamase superfamily)